MGEQRLEQLRGQRRHAHHDPDGERNPRAPAHERDDDQQDAPEDVQRGLEQVQQGVRQVVHPRTAEQREVVQRDRVFHVRRRHQRGHDPGQRERERAQPGDEERPGRARRVREPRCWVSHVMIPKG